MKKLLERMDDATARMEQVICIAGSIGPSGMGVLPDPLQELFEEYDEDYLVEIFGELPQWLLDAVDGGRFELADAFCEWAIESGHLGFLIQFATPIMKHRGNGSSYSWGHYNTRWIYADKFDTAVDAGLAWVEERRQSEKSKAQDEQNKAEAS